MKGLEVNVLKFSAFKTGNEFLRLDSEYFSKETLKYEQLISTRKFDTLENLAKILNGKTPQYDLEGTIPVVRSGELNYKWLDDKRLQKVYEDKELFYLKPEDVMISSIGSGSIGKVDIFFRTGKYATVSEVTVLRDCKTNPYFLAQYLSTSIGQRFINKYITGATGQLHLNKSSIKNILVPLFSQDFNEAIQALVIRSFEAIEDSKNKYAKAERFFLEELNLVDFKSQSIAVNYKTFNQSFISCQRLDAEYYQPKFDKLEAHLINTGQSELLGTLLDFNKRGKQPDYLDEVESLPVLNSKHIRENRIDYSDNRLAISPGKNSDLIIRKNDVLVNGTGVGTIGRCAAYLRTENALPDNHVTILRTDKIDSVFLAVQLNSVVGKLQVEKYFKGSSGQIELYPTDIDNFRIWIPSTETQLKIRSIIEQSDSLRMESESLLKQAKKAVEIAIEEHESVAIEFLNGIKLEL